MRYKSWLDDSGFIARGFVERNILLEMQKNHLTLWIISWISPVMLLFVQLCCKSYVARNASKYGVFSGPYFPVFGLNTGKYGPEETPYLDNFHAVLHLLKKGFIRHYLKLLLSLTDLQQLRFNILQVKGYQDGMTIT